MSTLSDTLSTFGERLRIIRGPLSEVLRPYRRDVRRMLGFHVASEFATLLRPFVMMALIDRLLQGVAYSSVVVLVALLVLIALVEGLFGYLKDHAGAKIGAAALLDFGNETWRKVVRSDRAFQAQWRGGDVVERVGGVASYYSTYSSILTSMYVALPGAVVVLLCLLSLNVWLSAVYVASVPVLLLMTRFFSARRAASVKDGYAENLNYRATALEVYSGLETVSSAGAEAFGFKRIWRHIAPRCWPRSSRATCPPG